METFLEDRVNWWRVINIVCWILLLMFLVIALPYLTMDFGGWNGEIMRFVHDCHGTLYGMEIYKRFILTSTFTEEYLLYMPIGAGAGMFVLLIGTYAALRTPKADRDFAHEKILSEIRSGILRR